MFMLIFIFSLPTLAIYDGTFELREKRVWLLHGPGIDLRGQTLSRGEKEYGHTRLQTCPGDLGSAGI